MLLIPCPHCGERPYTEFTYGGDAGVPRPGDPATVTDREWTDYLYRRHNPCGRHIEYWQHSLACRRWLKVVRDTATQEIVAVGDHTLTLKEDV